MPATLTRPRPGARLGAEALGGRRSAMGALALTSLLPCLAFLWYAVASGLSGWHAVTAAAMVTATQILPGALVWRTVRPRAGWLVEDVVMGFALGSCLAIAAQVVAGLSRVPMLSAVLPLGVGALLLALPVTRHRILTAASGRLPWWWGPAVAIAALPALTQLVSYFATNRLRWPPGAWQPHVDTYLHQALASQLLHRGPTSWPTVAGEDLGYHWFAHAWIAQTSWVSGIGLDEVLLRFMPAIMPGLVVVATAVAALRLSGRPVVGVVAAVLVMAGGHLTVFGQRHTGFPVEPISPTLALGAPTLVALVVVLALRWRGEMLSGAFWLVPVLAVVAAGTKGSTSPLVVAGLALAAGAMALFNRRQLMPVVLDLLVVAGGLVLTLIVVFHGSSAGLHLGLTEASRQTPLAGLLGDLPDLQLQRTAIVVTVLSMMSRAAPLFALAFTRHGRRDPLSWLLIGGVLAGAGATGVFSHPGFSQYYFARTAMPLMAIGAALGLVSLTTRFGTAVMARVVLVGVLGGAAIVLVPPWLEGALARGQYDQVWPMLGWGAVLTAVTAVLGLLVTRRHSRIIAAVAVVAVASVAGGMVVFGVAMTTYHRPTVRPVAITANLATTQAQIDAARWIRDHSAIDDLVMTNRHCTTPREPFGGCDSRRWVVTAFSERQSLVEGWTATPRATRIAPNGKDSVTVDYWKPDILRLNDGFIAAPTQEAADRLRALGVRWVYADHTRPVAPTLEPFAILRYRNPDVDVYELPAR